MSVAVKSMGEKVRSLGKTDPIPGKYITLTIDEPLQKATFDALKDTKKGAVIVSALKGEILAMVSKPTFDPNLFTMGKGYQVATDGAYTNIEDILLDNNTQPLLNRAISGVYPPGSTFKLVTAAAGLESGTIDKNFTIEDKGVLKVGEFSFANWYFTQYGRTEGALDVVKAIKRSNDIFFYTLGNKIGVEKLALFSKKFGLGERLGVDLPSEVSGLVPTEQWKKEAIGESWYLGDNYHFGIGQGYLLTTPLQVNVWTQALANGGTVYAPRLLKDSSLKIITEKFLTEKTLLPIHQGMVESCSPTGVAWPLFNFRIKNQELRGRIDGRNFLEPKAASGSATPSGDTVEISIACKTGTAQHGGEKDLPHAWITLYAPAYNPEIVVTVLKESSGEGSNEAAPIAKKILESYFTQ